MQHWEFVETVIPPYRTLEQKKQLSRKIRTISCVVLSVALGISFTYSDESQQFSIDFPFFLFESGTHAKYSVDNNGCIEFGTQTRSATRSF